MEFEASDQRRVGARERRDTSGWADRYRLETQAWVRRAVIGLNLCPFAKATEVRGRVRYTVTRATGNEELLTALDAELKALMAVDETHTETSLLIHPLVLADFLDFNDFLDDAEAVIAHAGFAGIVQLASFHPRYQFAGTAVDDIGNASNRSPYPTLQLLRESSVDRAVAAFPQSDDIFEANIATLERLGASGWATVQADCRRDVDADPAAR